MDRIVIIGNGISGVTAARYIRKGSSAVITLVSSESQHFFARTALMYAYMGSIRDQDLKPYEDDFWLNGGAGKGLKGGQRGRALSGLGIRDQQDH